MTILRVFPRRTALTPDDPLAFVGDPPLWRPTAAEVHVSVAFTWDQAEGQRLAEAWALYYPVVKLGGPAFDACPNGFTPGQYIKAGVTFTTHGCNNNCPWCLVHVREGRLREIRNFAPGYIIQDNNILQASPAHLERVGGMLNSQRYAIFSGGLEARRLDDWRIDWLRGLRISEVFLAADTAGALKPLERAIERLALPRRKCRVYVLIAYGDEDIEAARERLEAVWQLGGLPFAQLYQPADYWINYPQPWKALARTWSRPAAMFAAHKEV
ncbi:MAG: hypothetical protein EHM35_00220 [Planctomycetaceae bacterium]|nr:MAG: hypothetical protein EHM35_00220 [Planctomycetaceae bacterium]